MIFFFPSNYFFSSGPVFYFIIYYFITLSLSYFHLVNLYSFSTLNFFNLFISSFFFFYFYVIEHPRSHSSFLMQPWFHNLWPVLL